MASLIPSAEREGVDSAADLQSRGTEQTERTRRQRGRQAGGEQKENELFCPEAIQEAAPRAGRSLSRITSQTER